MVRAVLARTVEDGLDEGSADATAACRSVDEEIREHPVVSEVDRVERAVDLREPDDAHAVPGAEDERLPRLDALGQKRPRVWRWRLAAEAAVLLEKACDVVDVGLGGVRDLDGHGSILRHAARGLSGVCDKVRA